MSSTTSPAKRPLGWLVLALGALMATLMIFSVVPAASASTPDPTPSASPGSDEEPQDLPFTVIVNVKTTGDAVAGATVLVSGEGFETEGETGENGNVRIGIPTKEGTWEVELVESSLPDAVEAPEGFEFTREVQFGGGSSVTANFTLGAAERTTTSFLDQLISRTVNGLNFGLMLALAAIGLSLVFGTTGLSNFAHGEMVTFGALAALLFSASFGWSIWLAIPVAIVVSALFGLGMDAGLWRPLRRKGVGTVQLMIVSIGLSLALRYIYQMIIGGGTQQLPGGSTGTIPGLGPIRLTWTDVISMAISIVVIAAFGWWLMRTRIGRATRAVSDNPSLAAASGIDVDAVVRVVWVVAAGLAGLSGILWAYFRPGIKWDMGTSILLLIFAAVTLGGLGTAWGALIGAIIVGLLVEVSTLWIPSDLKYVGALVVLIVILLFRPQGILGRRERIG
ncbi:MULTISPECIES: branched-chain amino acid ABC transporter permease [unclassified Microbacterium]|uniref:branched-chain amino acid ABC transporter permease n=1 Tax=unclassified Microbacterium TaxID=2609290 RepID=UPI00214C3A7B|nr:MULTISPECIES: branched-chain amino acid ABC transporter permease [unclassified Microbacterium]MCR2785038.1 branched-chain amino acid ABC transporter permease [Microbacterium sp. zg.B96]WIM16574.1 branched-chain amino acid ABC transporter permease [Microbacterium sp. zg-B96]